MVFEGQSMERTSNPCDQSDSVDSRGVGRIPPSSVRVSMRVVVVLVAQNSPPQNYKGDVGLVATIYLREDGVRGRGERTQSAPMLLSHIRPTSA